MKKYLIFKKTSPKIDFGSGRKEREALNGWTFSLKELVNPRVFKIESKN